MKLLIVLLVSVWLIGILPTLGLIVLYGVSLGIWALYQNHLEMKQFNTEISEMLNKDTNKEYDKQKAN